MRVSGLLRVIAPTPAPTGRAVYSRRAWRSCHARVAPASRLLPRHREATPAVAGSPLLTLSYAVPPWALDSMDQRMRVAMTVLHVRERSSRRLDKEHFCGQILDPGSWTALAGIVTHCQRCRCNCRLSASLPKASQSRQSAEGGQLQPVRSVPARPGSRL